MSNFSNILCKLKNIYNFVKHILFFDDTACEDLKRKKFILNVLCIGLITFFFLLLILSLYSSYKNSDHYNGVSAIILCSFIGIGLISFTLSKRGRVLSGSFIILSLIYTCILYGSLHWGADLPTVLILLFLEVLMTGILINSKAGLICAVALSIHLGVFYYLGSSSVINIDYDWKDGVFNQIDVIEYSFILIFAALFSWLSNNQLEKSLVRSRSAERKLQSERDNLEIKVIERTEEIKILQIEKINSMYRMVEFGRISSGLFHDIISPITNISLNLQMLKVEEVKETMKYLIPSIKKMEYLISQSKKHIKINDAYTLFSIREEINSVVGILKSKAIINDVKIILPKKNLEIMFYGSQTLFAHIMMNLVSNAIDAHVKKNIEEEVTMGTKKVIIIIKIQLNNIFIKVIDNGQGIEKEIMCKIFEPFYTTKQENGCGIGLSATKHILEKYFNGKISVKSKIQKGSVFTVTFPLQR